MKETYLGFRESYPCYAPDLPQNITKTAKPLVSELVNTHVTRFRNVPI